MAGNGNGVRHENEVTTHNSIREGQPGRDMELRLRHKYLETRKSCRNKNHNY